MTEKGERSMVETEEFIDQRIAAVEQALTDDPASDYNKFGEQSDDLFQKILPHLPGENERHLFFQYEIAHGAMWMDLVEAAYIQGLKDGLELKQRLGLDKDPARRRAKTA